MKPPGPFDESILGFGVLRVGDTAIHRAYRGALFLIEKTDALGAFVGNDVVDILLERRMMVAVQFPLGAAFINRRIRAFGFAGPAIDTFLSDYR